MSEHMSMADYKKLIGTDFDKKKETTNKYHNIKTTVDGIEFDSKLEASRYVDLKMLLKAGQIKSFKRQPSFLFESGIRYRPDFIVWGLDGICWVEDSKGKKTADFIMKAKLWKGECTVYGKIPDMRGCCGLAVQIKLADCFNAVVVINRDGGIQCSLVDNLGCEECMKGWEEEHNEAN